MIRTVKMELMDHPHTFNKGTVKVLIILILLILLGRKRIAAQNTDNPMTQVLPFCTVDSITKYCTLELPNILCFKENGLIPLNCSLLNTDDYKRLVITKSPGDAQGVLRPFMAFAQLEEMVLTGWR